MSEVTSITYEEYLQVMGLLLLAKKHYALVEELQTAIMEIVEPQGIPDKYGHTSDAVWNDYSTDELLNRLEIKVEKRPKK